MRKIAIIGAGISGLSAGQMLREKHEVSLFEKSEKPGGLVRCDRVQDNLFHRVGGHVFNSRNQAVLDWFWGFFDRDHEFIKARRNAKIWMKGQFVGYPLENYLYQLDKSLVSKILDDFLDDSYAPQNPFSYPNFASFLQGNFGPTLYQLYFKPYNEKIWHTDLSNIPLAWLEGKLPMPNVKQMLLSNIVVEEETEMVHANFYYAKEDGSQFIANRLAQGLSIRFQSEIKNISKKADGFWLDEAGPFDAVVYTGDVRHIFKVFPEILVSADLTKALENFPSNGTSNLFCECDPGDISWLYLPDSEIKAHRIIYTGRFAESNNRGSKRETCVVEFSGNYSWDEMVAEAKKLPGNLNPLASNQEPNSYILHDHVTSGWVQDAKKTLEDQGIYLLGRFAEWEYYNMDKAIESAMKLAAKF